MKDLFLIKSARILWPWIGLILSAVILRLPFFSVPMISDEGGYAYVAHFWSKDFQLYKDIPFDRPQGIFLLYKIFFSAVGRSTESLRFAASFYNLMTLIGICYFVYKVFSVRAAFLSGVIFSIFSACPSIEGFTANAELFANLPLVLAAYCTWKEKWPEAGFFLGLAFFLKPTGLSGLMLLLVWLSLRKGKFKELMRASLAFFIFPLFSILHGISIGWQFFWNSFFGQKISSDSVFSIKIGTQIKAFFHSAALTLPALIVPIFLALIGIQRSNKLLKAFGYSWLASAFLGMLIGGNWFNHYYIQIIPPLAFFSGFGLVELFRLSRSFLLYFCLCLGIILFLALEVPFWFSSPLKVSSRLYHRPPYLISKDLSEFIASTTSPQDTIYVAFYEADIYYLSRRKAAVQQLYKYQFTGSQEICAKVIDSIIRKEPALVIWAQRPPAWVSLEEFQGYLERGYDKIKEFQFGIRVYKRK